MREVFNGYLRYNENLKRGRGIISISEVAHRPVFALQILQHKLITQYRNDRTLLSLLWCSPF